MKKIIKDLLFEVEWVTKKALGDLEYHLAIFSLNIEDWIILMTTNIDDPVFYLAYGNFWNGALDLDIDIYNRCKVD